MSAYFSLLVFVFVECIHVVMAQCPATLGPVVIVGTSIPNNAYKSCITITSVVIPSTIVDIGNIILLILFIYRFKYFRH